MDKVDKRAVVIQFNDYINSQGLDGLSSLITDDHTLIAPGGSCSGKEKALEAWSRFFEACPDYRNHFENVESGDDFVRVIGHATCSHKELNGPFLWTAKVKGSKVTEWHVMNDTPENRKLLGIK